MRLLRIVELALAALLAIAPAVLPPSAWALTVAHRRLGFLLLVVVACDFAVRWRRRTRAEGVPAGSRPSTLGAGDVLLAVALPVYVIALGSGRLHTSGDNMATRLLGPLIVRERTIDLQHLPQYQGEPLHYSGTRVGDRILPTYPLGTGLLSVPYAAVALAAAGHDWRPRYVNRWEKHLAALLAAAATAFLFLALRQRCGERAALGASFVFAFATTVFSCMSQALWSTTGEVFLLCLAIWLALGERASPLRCLAAGLAVGGAFACRPTAAIAALGIGIVLSRKRDDLAWYAGGASASMLLVLAVLYRLYGHPLGGYGLMHRDTWGHSPVEGLLGTLLSPSRGLLPFYPYLLAAAMAWRTLEPGGALRSLLLGALATAAASYVTVSVFDHWTGGQSIGPRLMTDAAPFLAILTLPAWLQLSRPTRWRAAFLVLLVFAAATQALSVYSDRAERADLRLTDSAAFWSLRRSQLAAIWCLPCPGSGAATPVSSDEAAR